MSGQTLVSGLLSQMHVPRSATRTPLFHRGNQSPATFRFMRVLWVVVALACLWMPGAAQAQDLNDSIFAINNEILTDTRLSSGLLVAGPPEVAREIAIVDSAMFDAANAASGLAYAPVAYSGPPVSGASVDIAALTAGYTALNGIFKNVVWTGVPCSCSTNLVGGSTSIQNTVLASINTTFADSLKNLTTIEGPSGASLITSLALGVAAGNANMRASGYTVSGGIVTSAPDTGPGGSYTQIAAGITNPYVPANTNPGTYIPPSTNPVATAPNSSRVAMFPTWGTVAPMGVTPSQMAAIEAAVPGPPPLTSVAYAQGLLQTECEGAGTVLPANIVSACSAAGFSPESTTEAKAALFWNDPGTTYQPPGHWLAITDSLAQGQGLSTLQAARLGSLVGQAVDNAGIAAWQIKYQVALWRPVTAINNCSNWSPNFTTCDHGWTSLIATPPHPDYLAGHPAFSGAAAMVLENFFNTDDIPVVSTSDAYCNVGNLLRGSPTGPIIACTVSPTGTSGLQFVFHGLPTIYGPASACTTLHGLLTLDIHNNPVSCLLGSTTFFFNPSQYASGTGCNDVVNPGGVNDSPLICPITETFATISDASQGPSGAEFSRVVGGIHTPDAVVDATNLGNGIGEQIASNNNIPEPGAIGLLATSFGLLAGPRWYLPIRGRLRRASRSWTLKAVAG